MSSLKHIAQALGLSKTTVSWVLSNKGDERKIGIETQLRVRKYAEQINYKPNLLAKSLSKGETRTIGLIVPSIGDMFYSKLAKDIELYADTKGYTVTFCSSLSDPNREKHMIEMFRAKKVDGLIIAPTESSEKEIEILVNNKFPLVLVVRYISGLDTNMVLINNLEISKQLVSHLIENQHCKKIAILTTELQLSVMQLRLDGYILAHKESGSEPDLKLCLSIKRANYETEVGKALDMLFEKNPDIDGFFFATHYLAMEALRYFHKHNIDIDNKISLACLDENPAFEMIAPKMLVAVQPVAQIAHQAVDLLIKTIKTPTDNFDKIVLDAKIIPN